MAAKKKAKKPPKKRRLRCDDCGELKDDVERTICPYASDLYDEEEPCKLCGDCYHERCMDI